MEPQCTSRHTVSTQFTSLTMVSVPQLAKRALIKALAAVAALLPLALDVTRDSPDAEVRAAYGKVLSRASRKQMPTVELRRSKLEWEQALGSNGRAWGRPPLAQAAQPGFRIQGEAVLLTYQSLTSVDHWRQLVAHVQANLAIWGVKHWCATCESCQNGRLHAHVMLQFQKPERNRVSRTFTFQGIPPNASANDYLNEGMSRRNPQQCIDRGFFYVYASKIGTMCDAGAECVAGNYMPAWVKEPDVFKYRVLGKWVDALWRHYKLEDGIYEQYLFAAREGVQTRKRNLDACKAWKEAKEQEVEMQQVIKRIRGNATLYQAFPEVPCVKDWLQKFQTDLLRYPLLLVQGPSASGKTEFAKSLFKQPLELKVGNSQVFPSKMVEFKRGFHDALILDDVRDLDFLVQHQEKLQGKYDGSIEFATTPGGTCFYTKYLFRIPTVVTINFTTRNLSYLSENDWLNKTVNRVLLKWPPTCQ